MAPAGVLGRLGDAVDAQRVLGEPAGEVDATVGGVTDDVAPVITDSLTSSVDAGSALLGDAPLVSVSPFATNVPAVDGVLSTPSLDAFAVTVPADRGADPHCRSRRPTAGRRLPRTLLRNSRSSTGPP